MAVLPLPPSGLPSPPWEALRDELLAAAATTDAAGDAVGAARLRATVERWSRDQEEWNRLVGDRLRVHHDINNALVGVSGNAQLLLMGPAGQMPGVRERLEVVLRESRRIQQAAGGLRELRVAFDPAPSERTGRGER